MSLYDLALAPFADYAFMRRALAGCLALCLGACPLGVILVLRRMSLVGDAMAHAILPGAAVGFLVAGFSLFAMTLGGILTGLTVAFLAGLVSRYTTLREDASFAAFYLFSLGLGVLLVSVRGSNIDLLHVLFGTVLGLDDAALFLMASIASLTMLALAAIYRPLVVECLDPGFLRAVGGWGGVVHMGFVALVVLNLVGGFQALGTLMVVGIMMLPATAARFWAESVPGQMMVAILVGLLSSVAGLLASYHLSLPASPAIILSASALYALSVLVGRIDSLAARALRGGLVAG
ncbi:metal ABC transporter permease [Aureimonas phyllosphaerae]|uniref:Zinc/manganese transport system permease protein n=1 Tax=Aureimonas phyllosphaerae TaxID=1166078 RepID=A0A7W6BVW0_9HYPH|nr:metal ABC transporter permease [Aureimonas phyllosphaerae]MBB3936043.1 zinc/manganese transport system permease protein [Aureimonas phyllosphaerae]MBB3960232.1 zinc/manganese transport system permease protein [Aureimonas phyllosphaerae]SFF35375.1 zinc/manganese transport system permease protein [Aureimonas phyllosphaerae]